MGNAYVVRDQGAVHFVTFTVHQWVDVFTRSSYIEELIANLKHCQQYKSLEIYSWVVMTNHCHLILRAQNENLSDIIRDFKKFTAKKLHKMILENPLESRSRWLDMTLTYEGKIWFWEEGYHGEEIQSQSFFDSKAEYIHMNPVKAGFVEKPEDYLWSSAGDFQAVRKGPLDLAHFG